MEIKEEDKALWLATKSESYSYAATYEEVREKAEEVAWWKVLWFQHTIPKHLFIGWPVILNKLSTRDRLIQWGYTGVGIVLRVEITLSLNVHSLKEFGVPI